MLQGVASKAYKAGYPCFRGWLAKRTNLDYTQYPCLRGWLAKHTRLDTHASGGG